MTNKLTYKEIVLIETALNIRIRQLLDLIPVTTLPRLIELYHNDIEELRTIIKKINE